MPRVASTFLLLSALAVPAFAADKSANKPPAKVESEKCDCGDDETAQRVFEMRTYITNEGKLPDLHKRFREHTSRIFKKHGIQLVGYWTPIDEKDGKANTLVYLIAFPSREAAEKSWKAFKDDPEWQKVYKESHKDGVIVKEVKSVFLDPTDYSPIK